MKRFRIKTKRAIDLNIKGDWQVGIRYEVQERVFLFLWIGVYHSQDLNRAEQYLKALQELYKIKLWKTRYLKQNKIK